jgi:hypothetical protein
MKKICPICKKEFTLKTPSQICDCERCTYIRIKLSLPSARSMTREEAIRYYGIMYDDPLRRLGKTKYKPLIRAIYDYCEENGTKLFTFSELPEETRKQFTTRSLSAIAARHDTPIRQTEEKVMNARGTAKVYVWKFTMRIES